MHLARWSFAWGTALLARAAADRPEMAGGLGLCSRRGDADIQVPLLAAALDLGQAERVGQDRAEQIDGHRIPAAALRPAGIGGVERGRLDLVAGGALGAVAEKLDQLGGGVPGG